MAITKEDVWRVASEIDREGGKPSALEIRRRLGTGSYTTITAALKDWKGNADDTLQADMASVPADVIDRLTQAAGDLYALALRAASDTFQTERTNWQSERDQLKADADNALLLADKVADEADSCRARVANLESEVSLLIEERAKAQGAAMILQQDVERERKRAESAAAELAQARVQVTAQQVSLDAAQRELEARRPARPAAGAAKAKRPTAPAKHDPAAAGAAQ